ncbi:flagellin [Clostridium estertheticum]|uniref:Flagellin n=1 Tax=Clostridium estertheticum TaxID=238834 RepID=A0AA47I656_9CLOT|nr:flagellin [Clostridium estertheticum]MBU3155076.1 VWA domain-containing protein [Clostridium estertheticum]WAG61132.1 VWA domain-containing protein [Clostridium estertheticum]
MIINHNINALTAYNKSNAAGKAKSSAMEKLSSGLRINSAADDAAGSAIDQKMKAQIRGLEQASRNIQDGVSLVQTAEAGLGSIQNPNLLRMRELIIQALNGTLNQDDRMKIQNELESVKSSINDIANNTEFNKIKVLTVPIQDTEDTTQPTPSTKLDIVFMVDNSGSMAGNINTVKSGIEGFVAGLNGVADTKVAIVNLCARNPYNIKDFESNPIQIANNLNGLSAAQVTAPYEIIQNAIPGGTIGSDLSYRQDSKKIFIIFTDTNNESSISTETDAKNAVEGSNISIGLDSDDIQTYVFGMGGSFPDDAFNEIADYTGGKIYHPSSSTDISDKLKNDLTLDIKNSIPSSTPTQQQDEMSTLELQVGANSKQQFKVQLFDARTINLGIDDVTVNTIEEGKNSLEKVDKAIQTVSAERGKFGSYQNALEHVYNNVGNYGYNLTGADSRISDADMAKEVMEMTKSSIIQQSAEAMLKQSDEMQKSVINLMSKWQGSAQ